MDKTNKKTLEEIIRVDHAGERGAIKIYEGQLLALKTLKKTPISCKDVTFSVFGLSLATFNAFLSIVISCILLKLVINK